MTKRFAIIALCILCLNINAQTVTDIDGNIYNTVTIGELDWMQENLRTTRFNDGTIISKIMEGNNWLSFSFSAFCWYNNDSANNFLSNGALYNGYVVENGKVCPTGWRVPNDEDWKNLEQTLGMSQSDANASGYSRGIDEGSKIAVNKDLWDEGELTKSLSFAAIDFKALPSGQRHIAGTFQFNGFDALWWSTSKDEWGDYLIRNVTYSSSQIVKTGKNIGYGISIRCVKENETSIIEQTAKNKGVIYPNPAVDFIYIDKSLIGAKIRIIDCQGKMVLQSEITNDKIDINSLIGGLYLIHVTTKQKLILEKLIIE